MKIISDLYLRNVKYSSYDGDLCNFVTDSYKVYQFQYLDQLIEYRIDKDYLYLVLPSDILKYKLSNIENHLWIDE